jgi:hypothetical protein
VISPKRPIPDNTQHSQETDIYAPDGIRTHNPSKQAATGIGVYNRCVNEFVVRLFGLTKQVVWIPG